MCMTALSDDCGWKAAIACMTVLSDDCGWKTAIACMTVLSDDCGWKTALVCMTALSDDCGQKVALVCMTALSDDCGRKVALVCMAAMTVVSQSQMCQWTNCYSRLSCCCVFRWCNYRDLSAQKLVFCGVCLPSCRGCGLRWMYCTSVRGHSLFQPLFFFCDNRRVPTQQLSPAWQEWPQPVHFLGQWQRPAFLATYVQDETDISSNSGHSDV